MTVFGFKKKDVLILHAKNKCNFLKVSKADKLKEISFFF